MKTMIAALAAASLSLGGCALFYSSGSERGVGASSEAMERANAVTIAEGDVIDIGALPGQRLEPGACGLFLFAAKPTKRFVFFANASTATGKIKLNGEVVTVARTEGDGQIIDQHFSEQTFVAPAYGVTIATSVDIVSTAFGGTRIEGGSLRLTREDGWSMVVPVGGATTCEAG